jgi:hypothetical protein
MLEALKDVVFFYKKQVLKKAKIFRQKSSKIFLCRTGTGTGKWSRISCRNRTLPDIQSVPMLNLDSFMHLFSII